MAGKVKKNGDQEPEEEKALVRIVAEVVDGRNGGSTLPMVSATVIRRLYIPVTFAASAVVILEKALRRIAIRTPRATAKDGRRRKRRTTKRAAK